MYGMGVHMAQGEEVDFGVVCPHWPSGFNGLIFKRNVFVSCMKSCEYYRTHNTSLESTFQWLSKDVLKFDVNIEVCE